MRVEILGEIVNGFQEKGLNKNVYQYQNTKVSWCIIDQHIGPY